MDKTIALVGAFDTKGADYAYLRDRIASHEVGTILVDFGVMGSTEMDVDISRQEVAGRGGGDLSVMQRGDSKDEAMRIMSRGLAEVVRDLRSREDRRHYRNGRYWRHFNRNASHA